MRLVKRLKLFENCKSVEIDDEIEMHTLVEDRVGVL